MPRLGTRRKGQIKMNDKIKHFIAGFVVCIVGYFLILFIQRYLNFNVQASLAGMLLAFLAGLLKELYDKFIKKTYFDWLDWAVTNVGGIIAFVAIEIVTCW
jgi:VanZ family protein